MAFFSEHCIRSCVQRYAACRLMRPMLQVEVTGGDGSRTITFKDGTVKELTTDGRLVVRFNNGDVKEECADGTVTYFYREARTVRTPYGHPWQMPEGNGGQLSIRKGRFLQTNALKARMLLCIPAVSPMFSLQRGGSDAHTCRR